MSKAIVAFRKTDVNLDIETDVVFDYCTDPATGLAIPTNNCTWVQLGMGSYYITNPDAVGHPNVCFGLHLTLNDQIFCEGIFSLETEEKVWRFPGHPPGGFLAEEMGGKFERQFAQMLAQGLLSNPASIASVTYSVPVPVAGFIQFYDAYLTHYSDQLDPVGDPTTTQIGTLSNSGFTFESASNGRTLLLYIQDMPSGTIRVTYSNGTVYDIEYDSQLSNAHYLVKDTGSLLKWRDVWGPAQQLQTLGEAGMLLEQLQYTINQLLAKTYSAGIVNIPSATAPGDRMVLFEDTDYENILFTLGTVWSSKLTDPEYQFWYTVRANPRSPIILDVQGVISDPVRRLCTLNLTGANLNITPGEYYWQAQLRKVQNLGDPPVPTAVAKHNVLEGTLLVKPTFKG